MTSLAGAAQAQVIRPGRITGVSIRASGVGGASSGYVTLEAELNNTNQAFGDVNNPPREAILQTLFAAFGATETRVFEGCYVPLSIPVIPGDLLALSQTISGTAPTTFKAIADFVVMENGG